MNKQKGYIVVKRRTKKAKERDELVLKGESAKRRKSNKPVPVNIRVILFVVLLVSIGFFAGVYHRQIIATIGPIFGYKYYADDIDLSSVQETYRKLKANFDGEINDNDLITGANKGLVEAVGDDHTVYMSKQESQAFDDSLSGSIGGGIGAELTLKDNHIGIVRVLSGTPAEKSGLRAGDTIISINDDSTDGWSVNKAVSTIRGEVNTTVKLLIDRNGERKEYSITRQTITVPSVESRRDGNVAILSISRFDRDTADRARGAITKLRSEGATSVILDLRGNGGGFLESSVSLAGLWLNNKPVVIEKNGNTVIATKKTRNNAILENFPTVVLVNESSASASEIVAGALKDYNVATIMGATTFGKGSVQTLLSLSSGSQLKVTTASWYTPLGHGINKLGIQPDVIVEQGEAGDAQLEAALKYLR
jgi:carboxyl-terminal processing protease